MEANTDRGCGPGYGPRADRAWVPSFGGDSGAFSEHEMTHILEIAGRISLKAKLRLLSCLCTDLSTEHAHNAQSCYNVSLS